MKIYIVSLFCEVFKPIINSSMLYKAQQKKLVEFELVDLRKFGLGPRKTVDDVPYGGGAGMVLKPEPIFSAVESIKQKDSKTKVILTTPRGEIYNQHKAKKFANQTSLILICGHYEGYDERINEIVDFEISIGDFIMTGGEIAAMAVIDSVVRLIPGVLGDNRSTQEESFSNGLLEYPHYTRPDNFQGQKVPKVLQSGNHAEISKWRKQQALKKTKKNRPDLIDF